MANNNTQLTDLPTPNAELQAHSQALQDLIKQAMTDKGAIAFADYMRMALYEPSLGYYSAGLQKFGEQGDFITAPEISKLFSYALASQCADVLQAVPDGSILEFGAGSGMMAADILGWLDRNHQLPNQYYIVELSADLKQRQLETLMQKVPHLLPLVHWLDSTEGFQMSGIVLANEVFDAMPVQRFQITESDIKELCVTTNENTFTWHTWKADPTLRAAVEHIQSELAQDLPCGYISEINPHLTPWFSTLSEYLQQGLFISIDYGYPRKEYYSPERNMGTLMCHYQHRAHHDPLILCGLQDITAYVDFTAVIEAAHAAGFELEGFTTQASFLIGCGIESIFNQATTQADDFVCLRLSQQLKKLTLPSEMGERFKVMGLSRNLSMENMPDDKKSLAGFSIADYSNRL